MTGTITTTPPIVELPPGSAPSSIAKGDIGATGPANTLVIGTISNGGVGVAAATITGTAPNQTLNMTLPQGATGATGATGPQGPAGATGLHGTPTANQIATFFDASTIQGVSITGLVKGNGASAPAAALAGTDYLAPPAGTALLKGNSGAALANATAGTDYCAATTGSSVLKGASGNAAVATAGTDYVAPGTATAFTAQQSSTVATLTDASSVAWDVSTRQKAKVTLGGNRTMAAVTNAIEGTTYYLWAIQDATGSRTLSYTTTGAGSFDFGTVGAPTLTLAASKGDLLCFEAISIAGTLKLRYCGIALGFS